MNRYLIYSSTAKPAGAKYALAPELFDTALVFCGDDEAVFERLRKGRNFAMMRRGSKIDNFIALAEANPAVLGYEYIVFADDDIVIEPDSLKTFLETTSALNLDWSQPAHSKGSHVPYWYFLKRKPRVEYEFVNFIEIQFFAIRGALLRETFKEWKHFTSGFGLDLFLSLFLKERTKKIAVIHSAEMTHLLKSEADSIRAAQHDFQESSEHALQFVESHFNLNTSAFAAVLPWKSYETHSEGADRSRMYWSVWDRVARLRHRLRMLDFDVEFYSHGDTQRSYWRSYAAWMFPRIKRALSRAALERWLAPRWVLQRLNEIVAPMPWMRVYEIGCGRSSLFFLNRRCYVSGADTDDARIASVVERAPKQFEGSLRLRKSSQDRLALDLAKSPDNYFDVIRVDGRVSMSNTGDCLTTAFRKLKPGGTLLVEQLESQQQPVRFPPNWSTEIFHVPESTSNALGESVVATLGTKPRPESASS